MQRSVAAEAAWLEARSGVLMDELDPELQALTTDPARQAVTISLTILEVRSGCNVFSWNRWS